MPYRSFVDKGGVGWDVWEVKPQWADRRSGVDRRQLSADDPRADPPVLEQRRGPDRRVGDGKRTPHVQLGATYSGGWLAFESPSERRRLAPIPPGWDQVDEPVLESLCDKANPVTVRRGKLID